VQVVFAAEALKHIVFMLPNALNQVTGHADVKSPSGLIGQYINEWNFHWHLH
jgi:hypothetical protein